MDVDMCRTNSNIPIGQVSEPIGHVDGWVMFWMFLGVKWGFFCGKHFIQLEEIYSNGESATHKK